MRISRKVWIIVGICIFAVVLGLMYSLYFREVGERVELENRLGAAQVLLPRLTVDRKDLEDQLAQATSSLNTNQAEFPESVESIEYDDDLFEIADDCDVGITSITASTPGNRNIGGVIYSVSPFTVVISGDVDDILDFIYALRTGDDFQLPWSAEMTGVSISVPVATISVSIYGYKR